MGDLTGTLYYGIIVVMEDMKALHVLVFGRQWEVLHRMSADEYTSKGGLVREALELLFEARKAKDE